MQAKTGKNLIVFTLLITVFYACDLGTSYSREVKNGIESGERNDSLFLDIHLRMDAKDFYTTCWDLNKEGLIMQGPGNRSVEYMIDSAQLRGRTYMRFYPEFTDGIITEMPVLFKYESWTPWNKEFSSDTLLPRVVSMMEDWYDGPFTEQIDNKTNRKAFYKIDGNRQILVYKKDTSYVEAIYTDIFLKNPLKSDDE